MAGHRQPLAATAIAPTAARQGPVRMFVSPLLTLFCSFL